MGDTELRADTSAEGGAQTGAGTDRQTGAAAHYAQQPAATRHPEPGHSAQGYTSESLFPVFDLQ